MTNSSPWLAFCWFVLTTPALQAGPLPETPPATDSATRDPILPGPVIAGFERFHRQDAIPDDHETIRRPALNFSLGALLVGELNCLSCHQAQPAARASVVTKTAPDLTNVAGRVKRDYLRKFIANPTQLKPGTTMPSLFQGQRDEEVRDAVEALVHFLESINGARLEPQLARIGARETGKRLYQEVGCLACHDSPPHDSPPHDSPPARSDGAQLIHIDSADESSLTSPLPTSVPHGDLSAKYTLPSLSAFLQNPLHVRPSGRMPDLNLSEIEAHAVAAYLLPNVPERAGVAFAMFRGNWQRLPDFSELTPERIGEAETISADLGKNQDNFGLRFAARFRVTESGRYRIHLGSDDGSRLWVNGKQLIDNDGVHGTQWKSAELDLTAGTHAVQIDFFEAQGGEELYVELEGPELERTRLDQLVVVEAEARTAELQSVLPLREDLIARGKQLFLSVGCANCHSLSGVTIPPKQPAAEQWDLGRGCLADQPDRGVPDYHLNSAQREAIADWTKAVSQGEAPPSLTFIQSALLRSNCYACHARDGLGGPEPERNARFQTTQKEMGDEGRLPPPLDGVGAKLTSHWLDQLLTQGGKDRPYMLTRMPNFGSENVGHLRAAFARVDSLPSLPPVELDGMEAKRAGWQMVGEKGFSCIKCHTFGRYRATGVQAIDMTVMTRRLQENWFRQYLRNPIAFRPGTRMPSAWPERGPSLLEEILEGDSERQIAAVWTYLSDERRAKTPLGLVSDTMELIAAEEPIIYRNFIEGAGARAIGVGFPESINVAFDANHLSLALIWQGAFINAQRHWTGRGEGFEAPMGEKVHALESSGSFAWLSNFQQSWPTAPVPRARQFAPADRVHGRALDHAKFRGYRLDPRRRPTFLYQIGPANIEDHLDARQAATSVSLQRTIRVTGGQQRDSATLYYRAAAAAQIQRQSDNQFDLGNGLMIELRVSNGSIPLLRSDGSSSELLVPIQASPTTIEQIYAW